MSLSGRLESADDAERLALLQAASADELADLQAALTYHQWNAESEAAIEAENRAFRAFESELAACVDDEAGAALISLVMADRDRGAKFLTAWLLSREDDMTATKRYLAGVWVEPQW